MFAESPIKSIEKQYAHFVNPQWVKLISALGLNRQFKSAQGAELVDESGAVFLDFLSGYGVYNVGHNHPYINQQLIDELQSSRPTMLQSTIPALAAELAERLCELAGGRCEKVCFTNTGSEGVESAIKFARSKTKRDWILFANGGFHGLTCGALSLMSNPWWREGFGPLLQHTRGIPFGDLNSFKAEITSQRYAAFIVEPIQGEMGVILPSADYFKEVQKLCDHFGTLLIVDEVQTGLFRTGPFLGSHLFGIQPDMVILAKALSGGQVPVGALLMRNDLCASVYSSIDKAFVHSSTFGENALAMRAGLATLDVLEQERLGQRSMLLGKALRCKLSTKLSRFEMIKEIRGAGLFNAIEFQPPKSIALKLLYKGFSAAHPGLFGQMFVKTCFEDVHVLSQMAGNNYMAIKSLPPLIITEDQLDNYADSIEAVCGILENEKTKFWIEGAKIAASAICT